MKCKMRNFLISFFLSLSFVAFASCQTTAHATGEVTVEYVISYGTPYSFDGVTVDFYLLNGTYYHVYMTDNIYRYRVINPRHVYRGRKYYPMRRPTMNHGKRPLIQRSSTRIQRPPTPPNNGNRRGFGGGRR